MNVDDFDNKFRDISEYILVKYPLPIKQAYEESLGIENSTERLTKLMKLAERIIQYLAVIQYAEYRHEGIPKPAVERRLTQRGSWSMGRWLGLLRDLAENNERSILSFKLGGKPQQERMGECSEFAQLWRICKRAQKQGYPGRIIESHAKEVAKGQQARTVSVINYLDALVECRNELAHGDPNAIVFLNDYLRRSLDKLLWLEPIRATMTYYCWTKPLDAAPTIREDEKRSLRVKPQTGASRPIALVGNDLKRRDYLVRVDPNGSDPPRPYVVFDWESWSVRPEPLSDISEPLGRVSERPKAPASTSVSPTSMEKVYLDTFRRALDDGIVTADERKMLDELAAGLGLRQVQIKKMESQIERELGVVTDTPSQEKRLPDPAPEPKAPEEPQQSDNVDWDFHNALVLLKKNLRAKLKSAGRNASVKIATETADLLIRFKHPIWTKGHHLAVWIVPRTHGHCAWIGTSLTYSDAPEVFTTPLERAFKQELATNLDLAERLGAVGPSDYTLPCSPLPAQSKDEFVQGASDRLAVWIEEIPPVLEQLWDELPPWAQVVSPSISYTLKYRTVLRHDCDEAREDPAFLNALAFLHLEKGTGKKTYQHAVELFKKLTEVSPGYPKSWEMLGHIANYHKDRSEAMRCFEEAYKRYKVVPIEHLEILRETAFRVRDYDRAVEVSKELLERAPDTKGALSRYARALMKAGRNGEAETTLQRCIAEGRGGSNPFLDLAKILHERGDTGKAIEILERCKKPDGDLYANARAQIDKLKGRTS